MSKCQPLSSITLGCNKTTKYPCKTCGLNLRNAYDLKNHIEAVHKGKQAMMEQFAKIPDLLDNFSVEPEFMIAEGNKVFTKCNAKADGMNTIFGHYSEYTDEGKQKTFITFDDTLSLFNAMK